MFYHQYSLLCVLFLISCAKSHFSKETQSELIRLSDDANRFFAEYSLKPEDDPSVSQDLNRFDSIRTRRLKELLGDHAWFSKESVGVKGLEAAVYLLRITSDQELRKRALPEVEKQARNGEIAKMHYAFLLDHIRMIDGLPLVYGTIVREVDGKRIPYPTEDSLNLNKRRIEVGLEPFE